MTSLEALQTPEQDSGWIEPAAWLDVLAERRRQVSAEGWSHEKDDRYELGELARAAACYAYEGGRTEAQREVSKGEPPMAWPWVNGWWKSTTKRRDLVKAGALILAEIERLDRLHKPSPSSQGEEQ